MKDIKNVLTDDQIVGFFRQYEDTPGISFADVARAIEAAVLASSAPVPEGLDGVTLSKMNTLAVNGMKPCGIVMIDETGKRATIDMGQVTWSSTQTTREPVGIISSRLKFGNSFSVAWKDGYWPNAGDKLYAAPAYQQDQVDAKRPDIGKAINKFFGGIDNQDGTFAFDPFDARDVDLLIDAINAAMQASQTQQDKEES